MLKISRATTPASYDIIANAVAKAENEWETWGISGLERIFGRFCGGFDNHGRELSKELGCDRDHNIEQNSFYGMFGIAVYLMIFR